MKQTKRLFAMLLSAMLAFALVPAQALAAPTSGSILDSETNTGRISITNAKQNETYSLWRMFDLISFRDSDPSTGVHPTAEQVTSDSYETYSYAIQDASPWFTFLTTYGPDAGPDSTYKYAVYSDQNADRAYFIIDRATSTVTLPNNSTFTYRGIRATTNFRNAWDSADSQSNRADLEGLPSEDGIDYSSTDSSKNYNAVQDFAQAAVAYAKANGVAPDHSAVATSTNVTFASVPLGYYLMDTSMGTLASLDTTNRNLDIYEKNDAPTVAKAVLKKGAAVGTATAAYLTGSDTGADAVWVKNTDADINDLVQFRSVITVQQGAENYLLHDVMEAGFEFVNSSTLPSGTRVNGYTGTPADYNLHVYLVKGQNVYQVDSAPQVPNSSSGYDLCRNWFLRTSGGTGDEAVSSDGCDFELDIRDGDAPNTSGPRTVAYEVVLGAKKIHDGSAEVTNAQFEWVELTDGAKIVVTYWAKVQPGAANWTSETNDNTVATIATNDTAGSAVTIANQPKTVHDGNGRNDNHTVMTYGAKSNTNFASASVTTYEVDIVKTQESGKMNAASNEYPLLDGAQFSIYKAVSAAEALDGGSLKSGYKDFIPKGDNPPTYYYQTNAALKFQEDQTDDGQQTALGTDYTSTHTFYRFVGDAGSGGSPVLASKNRKAIHLYGLEAGTYILVEDTAPAGFNKLAFPIVITIAGDADSDGLLSGEQGYNSTTTDPGYDAGEGLIDTSYHPNDGTDTTASNYSETAHPWKAAITPASGDGASAIPNRYQDNAGGVHVVNQTGQELPSTGGMGTTLFYVVGGALLVGAVVLFVLKRRMGTEA